MFPAHNCRFFFFPGLYVAFGVINLQKNESLINKAQTRDFLMKLLNPGIDVLVQVISHFVEVPAPGHGRIIMLSPPCLTVDIKKKSLLCLHFCFNYMRNTFGTLSPNHICAVKS